jgi:hypothetical protein
MEARVEPEPTLALVPDRQLRLELLLAQLDLELEREVVVEAVLGLDLVCVVWLEGERDGLMGRGRGFGREGPGVDAGEAMSSSLWGDRVKLETSVNPCCQRRYAGEARIKGKTNKIGVIGMDIGREDWEGDGDAA